MSCGCLCSYCVSCNSTTKGLTIQSTYKKEPKVAVKVKKEKPLYTKIEPE